MTAANSTKKTATKTVAERAEEHIEAQRRKITDLSVEMIKTETRISELHSMLAGVTDEIHTLRADAATGTPDGAAYAAAQGERTLIEAAIDQHTARVGFLEKRIKDGADLEIRITHARAAAHALARSGIVADGVPVVAAVGGFVPDQRAVVVEASERIKHLDIAEREIARGRASAGVTVRHITGDPERALDNFALVGVAGFQVDARNKIATKRAGDLDLTEVSAYYSGPTHPLVIENPTAPNVGALRAAYIVAPEVARRHQGVAAWCGHDESRVEGIEDGSGTRRITVESTHQVSWTKHDLANASAEDFAKSLVGNFVAGIGVIVRCDVLELAPTEVERLSKVHGELNQLGRPVTGPAIHGAWRMRLVGESVTPSAAK